MTVNTARTKLVIKELETPGLAIVPFALRLPPSFFQQPNLGGNGDAHDHHHHDDESLLLPPPPQPQMMDPTMFLPDTVGIVGTITIMRNAVMIWFGWGNLEFDDHDGDTTKPSSSPTTSAADNSRGSNDNTGKPPSMGPLMVAMPRAFHRGAFSVPSTGETASTKLVGCDDDEGEELLCRQMAGRLSTRLRVPVFCSCHVSSSPSGGTVPPTGTMDPTTSSWMIPRAAALAEKHIYQLLKDRNDFLMRI